MVNISRADVDAIFAYMKTVKPLRNKVTVNHLYFPFDQRWSMAAWRELYFTEGAYKPDPGKSASWNRGAYKGKTTTLGPMAEVVQNSLSFLTDADLKAMAECLWAAPTDLEMDDHGRPVVRAHPLRAALHRWIAPDFFRVDALHFGEGRFPIVESRRGARLEIAVGVKLDRADRRARPVDHLHQR